MSEVKHTPGPWSLETPPIFNYEDRHYSIPGVCTDIYSKADANLISAAPDHHAVALELDRLMLVIDSAVRWQDPTHSAAVVALLKANRAAIAKATGAQS